MPFTNKKSLIRQTRKHHSEFQSRQTKGFPLEQPTAWQSGKTCAEGTENDWVTQDGS